MRAKLRFEFGPALTLGPGKAALLEAVAAQGSIAGAGRAMGMSYKRAWSLIEEMNAAFQEPVVVTLRGGAGHGGAALTETGLAVVAEFRALERLLDTPQARKHLQALTRRMKPGLGVGAED